VSKILITGGTGLVGTHLTKLLAEQRHEVVFLSRHSGVKNGIKLFQWDPVNGVIDLAAFEGVSAIINLAGAGIADKRWTTKYKKELHDSRILSTRLLVDTIRKHHLKIDTFISTSAIGIYGNQTREAAIETDKPASNFLAQLCADWEHEACQLTGIRTVIIRVGIVLATESGFVPEVALPIKWGVGAALGNGKQYISWIHIDDLCGIYLKALSDPSLNGAYNAVSPEPTTNRTITQMMAKLLHRWILLPPIPAWVLALIFGELSTSLTADQVVSSNRIQQTGYEFTFKRLQNALENLLQHTN
jgi:uncharacterized protein